jgi:7-dehydrocholesterol reductase
MVMLTAPLLPIYIWASCQKYGCAVSGPVLDLMRGQRPALEMIAGWVPHSSPQAFLIFAVWCALQLVLLFVIPAPTGYGNVTPAGHKLSYRLNGLRAWFVTHVLLGVAVIAGLIPATLIYDQWGGLLIAANVWGFAITAFVYWKAHRAPSHPGDRHFSGSRIFDLFMGIELNPRLGFVDLKLFHIGRLGMPAWTVVIGSCAAAQHARFGTVTNSMVIVNLLQLVYVMDLFWREDWYLRTIDIQHDHFGFYLGWASVAWLPFFYTLQAFYLVQHPVNLSSWAAAGVLALGLGGYAHFFASNTQRNRFRQTSGPVRIWGKMATWIDAPYTTLDGERRESRLLTSGWWGMARHVNYVGDIMLATAFGLACGFGHILPYLYAIYLTGVLVHRIYRDDMRCRKKYGQAWDNYCKAVPYRLIPGIW